MAKGAIEQRDEPVIGRHLGHRVPDGQRARGHPHRVAGPAGFLGRRLEVGPGLIDLPGEQQAPAEPHMQVRIQAIRPPGQGNRRAPPCRRILPGRQLIGGLRG